MSKKYILQESSNGNLAVLGTYACAVTDEEDAATKSGNNKWVSFCEYEPLFAESDFESCYLQAKEMLWRIVDLCEKNQIITLFASDSIKTEKDFLALTSPEFPDWTFMLSSAMVEKYNLKTKEDGSIQLFINKIDKNKIVQVSPETADGKVVPGVTIVSYGEIIESLNGKEFEAVNVRVCDIEKQFIIVSYKDMDFKVVSDELFFEESDKRKDTSEYRKYIGHEIPMFPIINSGKLRFSEKHVRYTEDKSKFLPEYVKVGDVVQGIPVAYKKSFGVFVLLECGRSALLHVPRRTAPLWKKIRMVFPLGKTTSFKLEKVDVERIEVGPINDDAFEFCDEESKVQALSPKKHVETGTLVGQGCDTEQKPLKQQESNDDVLRVSRPETDEIVGSGDIVSGIKDILPQFEEKVKKECVYKFIVNGMDKTTVFLTSPNGFPAILPVNEEVIDKPLSVKKGKSIFAMVQGIDYDKQVLVLTRKPMMNFVLHGQMIECIVESVNPSSLVLEYKGLHSTLNGPDIADTSLDVAGMYNKGDIVKAMVIKYDWESGGIKLSIKAAKQSYARNPKPIFVGNKIKATVLIVEADKLIIQWGGHYGCISKGDALAQDILQMQEMYQKGQEVDCVVTSVKGGDNNYFTATTNPDFAGDIKKASLSQGESYQVTIIRQNKDCLIVGYGDIRGSIPNKDLYWGTPYAFDNEKYQPGKVLSAVCESINFKQCLVLFSYDKGMNEPEQTHVVSVEKDSVIVEYQGTSYKLDNGNCPAWYFSENDEMKVKPVKEKQTYAIRIQNDRSLLQGVGDKVTVDVIQKRAEGLVVMLPNDIRGYIPKEELGWVSSECDIDGFNLPQINDVAVVSIDKTTCVPCLSRRATIEDPMAGFEIGMKVDMCITKVSESLILGMSGAKNAMIEKQNAGWKFQFAFSEDLTTAFKVGDQLEATIFDIDRDGGMLSLGLDTLLPNDEVMATGSVYDVEVVTSKPNGMDRLRDCYLVKWDGYYGFMPYSEADYQPLPSELQYRPGEKVRACIYDHDEETGIPFMSHRRMIKKVPFSDDTLTIVEGDIVKAVIVDSSDLGILIKLKDYNIRSFIDLRQLYSTLQEMSDHPYVNGEEIEVVVKHRSDKNAYFGIPGFVGCQIPVGEVSTKEVTVLSKARTGYNVFTEDGLLAWLPAREVDFISYAGKINETHEQTVVVGQHLQGRLSHDRKRIYATFKVADVDITVATSVSNDDVTDVDNICLVVGRLSLCGSVYLGKDLSYAEKKNLETTIYRKYHTNFGKTEIKDGTMMRVKYQGKRNDGVILVSILELLDEA